MKFVVDSMLGKLAKRLRLLGYDTVYDAKIEDREMLRLSKAEGRRIVTRDTGVAKIRGSRAFLIRSTDLHEQLNELSKIAGIKLDPTASFSRCSECNTPVDMVSKEEIKDILPKFVYETMDKFSYCKKCKKAYWHGTHYDKLMKELKDI